jgi:uncharacterized tellurite resistance protein B-like protein
MRTYPTNSPEAAARIVALAMLADGYLSPSELAVLDRQQAHEQLGIAHDGIDAVLHAFCEDLLAETRQSWTDKCQIDQRTLAQLMSEIDDPALRRRVLHLCIAIVEADEQVTDGESVVINAAVEHWGLQRDRLQTGLQ